MGRATGDGHLDWQTPKPTKEGVEGVVGDTPRFFPAFCCLYLGLCWVCLGSWKKIVLIAALSETLYHMRRVRGEDMTVSHFPLKVRMAKTLHPPPLEGVRDVGRSGAGWLSALP